MQAKRINNILGHLSPCVESNNNRSIRPRPVAENKNYRFTANRNGILTKEQREQYEKDGYFVVKRLIPEQELEKYKERFIAIANGDVERSPTMTMMRDIAIAKQKGKGELAITKVQDFQDDDILFSYCKDPNVLKYVEGVIGANLRSVHTMLINKPPDVGLGSSRHPPHQDLWYFPFRPAEKIVASWTAMQHIDQENGCLCVEPGSHTGPLYKHEYPSDGVVNKAYHGIQGMSEADSKRLTNLIMEPGDTVFFHPLLIHGSGRNLSSRYRKAISCHYASADVHFEDLDGTTQAEMAKEIEEMAMKKGIKITFNDIWRLKSRLVSGKDNSNWNVA